MKRLYIIHIFISILSFITLKSVRGQNLNQVDSLKNNNSQIQSKQSTSYFNPNRFHFSLDLGTGFVGGSKFYSGAFTSIAPHINYQFTPKLSFEAGGILSTNYNSFYQNSANALQPNFPQKTNQFFIFTSGQYLLTEKLTITGSVFKTFNSNSSPLINPYFLDYKGMNIGLNYKLGEHMNIGAQFNLSNMNNLLLNPNEFLFSPYQHPFNSW